MPTPNSNATRFVVQTARIRIIRMSIKGFWERISTTIHTAARMTVAISRPMMRVEPQPQVGASLAATRRATSHADMSRAPTS